MVALSERMDPANIPTLILEHYVTCKGNVITFKGDHIIILIKHYKFLR